MRYFLFGYLWLLVLVSVCVLFSPSVSLDDIVERTPFGRELLIWFTGCSLCCCFLLIVILVIFHFDLEIGITSVPGHCLSFTFYSYKWDAKMSKIHGYVNKLFVMTLNCIVFYKYYTRGQLFETNDAVR